MSFPVLGLIGWLAISLTWSELVGHTTFLVRSELVPLVMTAAVVGTMPTKSVVRALVASFTAVVLWSLLASIVLPIGRTNILDGVEQLGFRGTFIHKNLLGAFAIYALCLALAFVRGRARSAVLALCLVTIVGSRSATVAAGLLGVLFAWTWMSAIERQRSPRERQFLLVLSLASAVASLLIALGLLPTLLGLYDKDVTFSGRTVIWAESLVTIREQPLIGYGYGGVWSDPTAPLTADLHHRITFEAAHSHNALVELVMGGGVVALGLALAFIAQALRAVVRCFGRSEATPYAQWGVLTLIALTIMGLAEPLLEGPHLGLLVVMWVVLARLDLEQRPTVGRRIGRSTFP